MDKNDSNYESKLEEIINQVAASAAPAWYGKGDYGSIPFEKSKFIIEKDFLNVYYPAYSIAAYAYGMPCFKIPYTDISDMINYDGELWHLLSEESNNDISLQIDNKKVEFNQNSPEFPHL